MRKTLKQLIEDEHFAIQKLNDYGENVQYYANQITDYQSDFDNLLREASKHTEEFIVDEVTRLSILIDYAKEMRDEAIEKRDAAIQELTNIRRELKQYLLDIINEY